MLAEAWELVDDGHLSRDDFRDFTFANTARLYADANPAFFEGTPVSDAVRTARA